MPKLNISRETAISRSARARQLEGMFDVPPEKKCRLKWTGDFPYDAEPWNVGLIVGPSGCGKSTILSEVFGEPKPLKWAGKSVVDDFDSGFSMKDVSAVCQAVGFNTIPAWLRPFKVLSNGERFRVDMARRLLETDGTIVVDEFTSVVDRQVAQVGSHAVQKHVRRTEKQFVAASCHYDIIDWLQPDWVLEPATMRFQRRSVQRRPELDITIGRVPYAAWSLFAPFHYLTASLSRAARCFGLWVGDRLAAFTATLARPHPKTKNIIGFSRSVTLPDWQGLGLIMVLTDTVASAWRGIGKRVRCYPAHPAFIHTRNNSPSWAIKRRAGYHLLKPATTGLVGKDGRNGFKGRPCAIFEYVGPAMPRREAQLLLQVRGS